MITGAGKDSNKKFGIKDIPDGSRIVTRKNDGKYTLTKLNNLRQQKSLCDVIFKVNGTEIFAHRNVLAINSDYFYSMFADGFHEMHIQKIELPSDIVDRQSAEMLVDFMYTGQFIVTAGNVQGLIMAADHWQMPEAKDICVDYMERQVDSQNCLGVLSFAEMYHCEQLAQKCKQLIKQHFSLVVDCTEFLHLSKAKLEQILSFQDLTLGYEGEDVVLKALFRWLGYNSEQRKEDLLPLLSQVHLSATSRECRKKLLQNNQIVQENKDIQQFVLKKLMEPVELRITQSALYVIGGFLQSRTGPTCPRLRGVECLDTISGQWTSCADFPMLSSASVAFSVHSHIFCAAFEPVNVRNGSVATETKIWEYNFIRNEWTDVGLRFSPDCLEWIGDCLQADGALAVCHRTNTIYTVSNSAVCSMSVSLRDGSVFCHSSRLLPQPGEFFTEQQRLHSAVVLNNCLYVLGGDRHDAGSEPVPTARVIKFDLNKKCWESCANMLETRAKLGAVVHDGYIYACGGFNVRRLATMERYNPETDSWCAVKAMDKYRSHHQVLVLQNHIWAIGGKSYAFNNGGARKVLNTCEVYDPQTDTWTEGPPMKLARCGFAAVTV